MEQAYTPLSQMQLRILFSALTLSFICLFISKSFIIKQTSTTYIVYAFFSYLLNIRHFQYMLPFYPLAAILIGYLISNILKKTYLLKLLFVILFIFWSRVVLNEINFLHASKINLATNIRWEQMVLDATNKDDLVLYVSENEHYFGGLRKQPLGYYWFGLNHVALIDYKMYKRHDFPDLQKIIEESKPKIIANDYGKITYQPKNHIFNQLLNKSYLSQHYQPQSVFYLRKD
jgi:hypothetical protein